MAVLMVGTTRGRYIRVILAAGLANRDWFQDTESGVITRSGVSGSHIPWSIPWSNSRGVSAH